MKSFGPSATVPAVDLDAVVEQRAAVRAHPVEDQRAGAEDAVDEVRRPSSSQKGAGSSQPFTAFTVTVSDQGPRGSFACHMKRPS